MHETTSTFTQTNKQTKIEKRWKTNPLSSHVLNFDVKVRSICVKMFLFSLRYCREEKKRRSWVLVRCVEVSSYALLHTDIILWSTYVRLTDTNTHTLTHSHTHTHTYIHTHIPIELSLGRYLWILPPVLFLSPSLLRHPGKK